MRKKTFFFKFLYPDKQVKADLDAAAAGKYGRVEILATFQHKYPEISKNENNFPVKVFPVYVRWPLGPLYKPGSLRDQPLA